MHNERVQQINVTDDDNIDADIERLIEWAEPHRLHVPGEPGEEASQIEIHEDFCSSDLLDDRVGLPSAVLTQEEFDNGNQLLSDRKEIDSGCSVEDECVE